MPTTDEPGPDNGGPGRTDDPFEGLVLDEEFVRSAKNREASGRARMLAERWKKDPPPANEPWRPTTEVRSKDRPTGPARPHPVRNALLLLGVVVAVLVGLAVTDLGRSKAPESSALPTVGAETAPPSSAPPSVDPDVPTPERPWAGSPAATWPNGTAGIGGPDGTPATGVFSAEQVAADVAAVRQLLVASNLDPQVLSGGDVQHVIDLMDGPDADRLREALAHPDAEHDPVDWVSRFDPARALPITDQVKVQGRISVEGDGARGLLVHADVTFVYAVRPGPDAGKPEPDGLGAGARSASWTQLDRSRMVEREIVRREMTFRFYDPEHYDVTPGKPRLGEFRSEFDNNWCERGSGYLQPGFVSLRTGAGGASPTGPTTDPYDRTEPLPEDDGGCRRITRS
ncbi:hypothetical protein ACFQ2M_18810 [Kitasatospora saccharophila]|uniref:SCO2583/SCO2584 N-terminal domain-containing protein n=1 Tax=Kitasatospora saccharophila TaxID=407973 RepID=UPI0031D936EC